MKTTIRILLLLIVCSLFILPMSAQGLEEVKKPDQLRIGISKIVTHQALDAIEKGIRDYLGENGINAVYDVQSANGEVTAAIQIAQKFKNDKFDMAIGIATPTAQALANVLKDVPVIFGGVTDPLEAGLVPSYEANDGNVGGASDLNPVFDQVKLFSEITGAKTIGIVFTSGEANGVQLRDMVFDSCQKLGLNFVEAGVSNSAEVKSAILSIAKRIDGLYIGTDNTVVSAIASLSEVCAHEGIPYFTADPTSAEGLDFFMVWGFDYYKHGRKAGEAAYLVLSGQKTAGQVGTLFSTDPRDFELWFNLDVAKRLGIDIDKEYIESAAVLIEDGQRVNKP